MGNKLDHGISPGSVKLHLLDILPMGSRQMSRAICLCVLLMTSVVAAAREDGVHDAYLVAGGASASTMSAAFSPIIAQGACVFPLMTPGMIEASTTRRPSMPRTRSEGSTTDSASSPI